MLNDQLQSDNQTPTSPSPPHLSPFLPEFLGPELHLVSGSTSYAGLYCSWLYYYIYTSATG